MIAALCVFLGGGLGALGRYYVVQLVTRFYGASFPFGTLSVNLLGSFLMGLVMGWLIRRGGDMVTMRLFLATGFLGGFTTFSTFSLDVVSLWERGAHGFAFFYVLTSVGLCVCAVFAGLWLMRMFAAYG